MAGVSGPMMRRRPADGARFLAGLAAGGVLSGLLVALLLYVAGRGLHAALPETPRTLALAAVALGFGIADLAGRTPHAWRQVPQVLVHRLRPGFLGVVWGFDLGLLVTTQKAASLVWAGVAAVVLLDPRAAAPVMVGLALLSNLSVALASVRFTPALIDMGTRRERLWLRSVRALSGTALVTLAAVTAVQAL
ncbi:hypothetical protein [Actinomadura madurae]|uniref:hypothetical protein n=1 Tax=Actinomadura madurae TaxID=1993 RepID=UPI002026BA4C|nr:hypothetical protein [Actinomadura madurae]MCP9983489.1 hypothetical protein [Actinomadura madurae]URM99757.1 hypothetical protein LUW76_38575 [Actinomadura madurae]URN10424.1 hypothetical protein LUW74_48520 [Actinomadura madurae]